MEIRKPAVSGFFYPQTKQDLLFMLKSFFQKTKKILRKNNQIKALIVPHAGYIYSGQTAAWGYAQLPKFKNQQFVLIGPSHHFVFDGLCGSTNEFWQTPFGIVKQLVINNPRPKIFFDNKPHAPEHSLEVQLPFLQYCFNNDFLIFCFLTGSFFDAREVANYLLKKLPSSMFVFSSDLSHYLSQEEATKKDKKTIEAILNLDVNYFMKEDDVACGMIGVLISIMMAKQKNWRAKLVYYDTSATASDDSNTVVGYSTIVFYK